MPPSRDRKDPPAADAPVHRAGGGGLFPSTARSAVAAIGSDDSAERKRAWKVVTAAYWRPIYKYIRLKWRDSTAEAQDLTQAFFARAFEKEFFSSYDPKKARFRTFVRVLVDRFVADERKAARRLKRGGGLAPLPLDFEDAERELSHAGGEAGGSMEDFYDREWMRTLFRNAIEALRTDRLEVGKEIQFKVFELYDLGREDTNAPTYLDVARKLGIAATDVANHLVAARRDLRRLVLESLREITATDEEFRSEARLVLGVDAP